MSASQHARRERQELCELFLQTGPDAPTLCGDWTTHDLAAHLVVRESRPDALPGIVLSPFAGWTDRLQRAAASAPYPELVRKVRSGPPRLSVFSVPGTEGLTNLVEYVVHHEDVLRAQPDWVPRVLQGDLPELLWQRLRHSASLMYRSMPVGITLERTDGSSGEYVPRGAEPMVTLRGTALELLMRTYGRRRVDVEVIGDPQAVAAFERVGLSI